jgi:hypothetical protein
MIAIIKTTPATLPKKTNLLSESNLTIQINNIGHKARTVFCKEWANMTKIPGSDCRCG